MSERRGLPLALRAFGSAEPLAVVGHEEVQHLPRFQSSGESVWLTSRSVGALCTDGIWPRRPAWKSSNACWISALVFITNGPAQAIGSRIGRPPSSRTSIADRCESCEE